MLRAQHSFVFAFFFFFNDTATTEIYTLSLHDALPILGRVERRHQLDPAPLAPVSARPGHCQFLIPRHVLQRRQPEREDRKSTRLNSSHSQISYAVFCLKKKKQLPKSQQYQRSTIEAM